MFRIVVEEIRPTEASSELVEAGVVWDGQETRIVKRYEANVDVLDLAAVQRVVNAKPRKARVRKNKTTGAAGGQP